LAEQFCTDVILLDGQKLHQYSGGVCSYEKMRRQLDSSRRREYEAQEKAFEDGYTRI
jgi:ATPase subunit of ABC transporter with duplicated ATPase domains